MVASGGAKRCTHCGASDTPLWRVGPSGPKTLCNACGLRWRKTGRLDDEAGEHHGSHGPSNARSHTQGVRKSSAASKHAAHGSKKVTSAVKANIAAQKRAERERTYSPASFVSEDDDTDVQLLNVERYGRSSRANTSPVHYWPPVVEEFRRSAVRKSERSYTVDDFWPLYRNVFSGLMVVQKTPR